MNCGELVGQHASALLKGINGGEPVQVKGVVADLYYSRAVHCEMVTIELCGPNGTQTLSIPRSEVLFPEIVVKPQ